jgi:hypothetical protein
MQPRTEARFALGSRDGLRSTIWKAWVNGDDAYLATRMFGKYQKVSFHSSGQCQWSCTSEWVVQEEGRRNSDRHIVKWEMPEAQSGWARLIFNVDIPMSEMRSSPPITDKKKVFWVTGAPMEGTVRFVFFDTPISENDPAPSNTDARQHLFSLRFKSGRWIVILVELVSLSPTDLSTAKRAVVEQFLPNSQGHELAKLRSVLFYGPKDPEPRCHGFIELCLDEA